MELALARWPSFRVRHQRGMNAAVSILCNSPRSFVLRLIDLRHPRVAVIKLFMLSFSPSHHPRLEGQLRCRCPASPHLKHVRGSRAIRRPRAAQYAPAPLARRPRPPVRGVSCMSASETSASSTARRAGLVRGAASSCTAACVSLGRQSTGTVTLSRPRVQSCTSRGSGQPSSSSAGLQPSRSTRPSPRQNALVRSGW